MPKANVNGINIGYNVSGQGEPLVLITGFAGTENSWIFQKRAFKKYFQVVTFDNRGVGRTDKPDGPYTIRSMADDTVGLIDYLGIDKAHILGVSMGGMIAQELAINYPERVQKLILGSTFARRDEISGHSEEYRRALGLDEGYTDDDVRRVPIRRRMSVVFSLAFNERLYRTVVVPLSKVYARSIGTKGVAAQLEAILGHDTMDRLHLVQAPTLVIAGMRDRLYRPRSSDVLATTIPNARLVKVDRGSHAFFMEMRGRFNNEVLSFLRGS